MPRWDNDRRSPPVGELAQKIRLIGNKFFPYERLALASARAQHCRRCVQPRASLWSCGACSRLGTARRVSHGASGNRRTEPRHIQQRQQAGALQTLRVARGRGPRSVRHRMDRAPAYGVRSLLPLCERRTKPAALPKSAERSRPRRAPVGCAFPPGSKLGQLAFLDHCGNKSPQSKRALLAEPRLPHLVKSMASL